MKYSSCSDLMTACHILGLKCDCVSSECEVTVWQSEIKINLKLIENVSNKLGE